MCSPTAEIRKQQALADETSRRFERWTPYITTNNAPVTSANGTACGSRRSAMATKLTAIVEGPPQLVSIGAHLRKVYPLDENPPDRIRRLARQLEQEESFWRRPLYLLDRDRKGRQV
jgi:hypothetical protein